MSEFCVLRRIDASDEHLRFYISVEAHRGVPGKGVLHHLHDVFGDVVLSSSFVYKWHQEFTSKQRTAVETLPWPGRPTSQRNDENI